MNFLIRKFQMIALICGVIGVFSLLANDCDEPEVCFQDAYGNFFFDVEALYLRAYQGGLSNPCNCRDIESSTAGGLTITKQEGSGYEPQFKWNFGFRLGAGYEFCRSPSSLLLSWTHLDSKTGGYRSNWKLGYEVVDLVYGYHFAFSSGVILTPFLGLKYANISQELKAHFSHLNSGVSISSASHVKQDLSMLGPCFGLLGVSDWDSGFGLYGNIAVSYLYGSSSIHFNQTDIGSSQMFIDSYNSHPEAYQYLVDAALGIHWKCCICEMVEMRLRLGLETHRFFNQNGFFDYGDLSLDGLTFGVSLEY